MRYHALFLTATLMVVSLACDSEVTSPDTSLTATVADLENTASKNGPPMEATMQVGRNDLGTDFFPPGEHDGSFHAKDRIRPGTVVISAGGTVTFNQAMFHTVAIYEDGVTHEDIDTSLLEPAGLPFDFPPIINDPEGRLLRTAVAFPEPTEFQHTFDSPGTYLVICEVLPHFAASNMYGYVIVK
jgi:plastocyanin